MQTSRMITVLSASALAAGAAMGQAGWIVETLYAPGQTSVNPQFPSVRVVVSAYFPPNDYALAGSNCDLTADDSTWRNFSSIAPITGGTNPPIIFGSRVVGILSNQLNFPQANIYADPRNPIPAFQAVWFTDDFRPRAVGVRTQTLRFDVYLNRNSPVSESRLSHHTEGLGSIIVTPAPTGITPLAVAGAALMRRRM